MFLAKLAAMVAGFNPRLCMLVISPSPLLGSLKVFARSFSIPALSDAADRLADELSSCDPASLKAAGRNRAGVISVIARHCSLGTIRQVAEVWAAAKTNASSSSAAATTTTTTTSTAAAAADRGGERSTGNRCRQRTRCNRRR